MTDVELQQKLSALCAVLEITPEQAIQALQLAGEDATMAAPARRMTIADYTPQVEARTEKGTLRAYRPYWRFLIERHGDELFDDVTNPMLKTLLAELQEGSRQDVQRKNWKEGYGAQRSAIHAWRCLWRDAVEDKVASANPASALKMPKKRPSDRRPLTHDEISKVYEVAATTGDDPELDTLLLRLLLETGCRRAGALSLRVQDLDIASQLVKVREKGKKSRQLPVTKVLMETLVSMAKERGVDFTVPDDAALRYRKGTPLTDRRFDYLFKRIQEAAPFHDAQFCSAHWYRHTAITAIERVSSEAVAAKFAGHSQLRSVTGIYTTAPQEDVLRAWCAVWDTNHPLCET